MIVEADRSKHQVIIRGDLGTEIVLNWSAALVLGGLMRDASVEAEPPALSGRSYSPTVERDRR
ncbi:MAG: hypothetical protein M3Q07_07540 [Pseudobdellovibrionaceae bacterium]|nr:hypothetical protein [Pseudobdellovibrionaceae bacterium]